MVLEQWPGLYRAWDMKEAQGPGQGKARTCPFLPSSPHCPPCPPSPDPHPREKKHFFS